jgi:DNA-binding transcriptional LysR family regulator
MSRSRSPLRLLIPFEAASRHGSFTTAAKELSLTPAAVSQQIRALESFLGCSLFHRVRRSVLLTTEGKKLARATTYSLEQLEAVILELRRIEAETVLTVVASPAFSSLWLQPRLSSFLKRFPNVTFEVVATDQDLQTVRAPFDVGVWGGYGRWPDLEAELLWPLEAFPVCSSEYLKGRKLSGPDDLLNEKLLHLNTEHKDKYLWMDWKTWLSEMGTTDHWTRGGGLQLNNYSLLIQAAREGLGIALGWSVLVADLIKTKQLIRPIPQAVSPNHGYYLIRPNREMTHIAKSFRDWLIAEARAKVRTNN